MKSKFFTITLLIMCMHLLCQQLNAATFTFNGAAWANWNVTTNWTVVGFDADGLPDSDDDVTVPAGFQVTQNLTSTINSLTLNGDLRFRNPVTPTVTIGTLNMNGGTLGHNSGNRVGVVSVTGDMKLLTGTCTVGEVSLTVAGTLRVYSTYNESSTQGTITFNAVQMYFGSNWFYNNNETFNITNNFTMKGATVDGTANGRFIISGNLVIDSTSNNWGQSRLTCNGTIIVNNGATLNITQLPGTKTVNNITVNSGGTWTDLVGESWTVSGDITNNGTFNSSTGGVWTLSGTSKTISGTQTINWYRVTQSGTRTNNGLVALANNLTINGTLTNNGTITVTNTTTVNSALNNAGTLNCTGALSCVTPGVCTNTGTVDVTANLAGTGTYTQGVNGTILLRGANNVTTFNASASGNLVAYIRDAGANVASPADGSYYDLRIGGAAGNKSLTSNTVVQNDLTIDATGILDVTNANNYQLNIGGDWLNNGTFNERSGLVVFDGASAQSITSAATETFFDLQFNNSGTKTLGVNIVASDDIDILSPATLDASASNFTITLVGDWNNTGTFLPQQGTVTFSGAGTSTLGGGGTNDFYNLTISKTTVTLNTTATLQGSLSIGNTSNFTTTGQTFTILSNSTGTGRIAALNSSLRLTGNITMQRFVPGSTTGWGLLGSCISTTLASWTDDFPTSGFTGSTGTAGSFISIYSYDETVSGVFSNPAAYIAATNSTNAVTVGSGRWVYLGTALNTTSDITVDVTGSPKIGNQNFGVTYTVSGGASNDGWNLLANPYPSTIDWNAASGWTKSNVSGTIYIWNADFNQFATWNGTTGTNGGTRYIASSQGFYVQTTGSSPTLQCTESVKSATDATMLREAPNNGNGDMIRFTVSGASGKDESLFGFNSLATDNYDMGIDAAKLRSPVPGVPSLFQVCGNSELAMNFVSSVNRNTEIKLKFITPVSGDFKLTFDGLDKFPENECIVLRDMVTGTVTDVRGIREYSFYADASEQDVRFIVQISSPLAVESSNVTCGNQNDGVIMLPQSVAGWSYSVKSSDGNVVKEGKCDGISIENLTAGDYVVHFTDASASCKVMDVSVVVGKNQDVKAAFEVNSVKMLADGKMEVDLVNASENGVSTWNFGDGITEVVRQKEFSHVYQFAGRYVISLQVKGGACEQKLQTLVETPKDETASVIDQHENGVKVFTSNHKAFINVNGLSNGVLNVSVYSLNGQLLIDNSLNVKDGAAELDLSNLPEQIYLVKVIDGNGQILFSDKVKN